MRLIVWRSVVARAAVRECELGLFRLFDVSQTRAGRGMAVSTHHTMFEKEGTSRRDGTHSMPRSTSGMAVSIASELVTLPSSPSLRSTLYRGSSLSNTSSCAFPLFGRTLALAPAAVVLAAFVSVSVSVSADCSSRERRCCMFSSMYAILCAGSVLF